MNHAIENAEDLRIAEEAEYLLWRARAKIEQGWCQGASAQTSEGKPTMAGSCDASRWCMSGALEAATRVLDSDEAAKRAHAALRWSIQRNNLEVWNDVEGRTRADVLNAYNRAIAKGMIRE